MRRLEVERDRKIKGEKNMRKKHLGKKGIMKKIGSKTLRITPHCTLCDL